MTDKLRNRTSIFRAKEVPYVFGLVLAAIAWIVAQGTDRLLDQPVLEVDVKKVEVFANEGYQCGKDDKQGSYYFRIILTNLAPDVRLEVLTAYFRTPDSAMVKAGRILEVAPSWSQTAAPTCDGKLLTFDLQGIQPFASVVTEMVTSSPAAPIFHFESTDAVRIKRAGLETWGAKNEILIYAVLLTVLVIGVLIYATILGTSHADN